MSPNCAHLLQKFPSSLKPQLNLIFCLPSPEPSGKQYSVLNFSPYTCMAILLHALKKTKTKKNRANRNAQFERDGTCRVNTKGIIKQTVIYSSLCGHSGKRSGQWQLTQLHSNTTVHITRSVKTSLPWHSSVESWTQSIHFVILWRGWLVCFRRNDPGFPVVTVTEVEAGKWKQCRYPSILHSLKELVLLLLNLNISTLVSKCNTTVLYDYHTSWIFGITSKKVIYLVQYIMILPSWQCQKHGIITVPHLKKAW